MRNRLLVLAAFVAVSVPQLGSQAPKRINFVSCPIVQDTATVPCWLSEYEGEQYYLGIQTDISAEFDPPYLGHQALVEGIVSDEPRICGGIVLKPVVVSPMPELDQSCSVIRPAVPQFTVPFAPRPPGPSGGRLAFDPPPSATAGLKPPYGPRSFELFYDVDMLVMGRHSGLLTDIFNYAQKIPGARLKVSAFRGATKLSNGRVLTERPGISKARAEEIAELFEGAGIARSAIRLISRDDAEAADGIDDWRSRRVTVLVEP
jgi:hypothetical protein